MLGRHFRKKENCALHFRFGRERLSYTRMLSIRDNYKLEYKSEIATTP